MGKQLFDDNLTVLDDFVDAVLDSFKSGQKSRVQTKEYLLKALELAGDGEEGFADYLVYLNSVSHDLNA
jgi:hypothetical protein